MIEEIVFKILVVNAAIVKLNCGNLIAFIRFFPIFTVEVFLIL